MRHPPTQSRMRSNRTARKLPASLNATAIGPPCLETPGIRQPESGVVARETSADSIASAIQPPCHETARTGLTRLSWGAEGSGDRNANADYVHPIKTALKHSAKKN